MEILFAVLNPGGRDKNQIFAHGAGTPSDRNHPPVNYHAYAACCHGGFYRSVSEIPKSVHAVLVLLRRNGLGDARAAVRTLKKRRIRTFVSWKESGLHQVSEALSDARRYTVFAEICATADGYLSSTPDLTPLYEQAGSPLGAFIPTPYPVDVPAWNFCLPAAERVGVFIGTREFDIASRNHLLAISAACHLNVPITVINPGGRKEAQLLKALSPDLQVISSRLPFPEYLRLMARHRLVFQLDRSAVPGQVAGDALLCQIPCVGGDGAIDRLAFPALHGHGRATPTLLQLAERLFTDEAFYFEQIALSQKIALAQASFAAGLEQLGQLTNS